MKRQLFTTMIAAALLAAAASPALGQSLSDIQGKWTVKKNTRRFGEATQTLEFKNAAFTFKVVSQAGDTLLYAKGKAKVEKLGPFNVIKLTDIEAGDAEADLQATDDDRTIIYATGGNSLTLAMNFDRSRDEENAECDTYGKTR